MQPRETPTPEQIRKRCERIRSKWTPATRRMRRVELDAQPWELKTVEDWEADRPEVIDD